MSSKKEEFVAKTKMSDKKEEIDLNTDKLEWINLIKDMENRHPDQEPQTNRLIRKFKEEPLVPIGMLFYFYHFFLYLWLIYYSGAITTAVCLTMGLISMKRNDSKKQQFYMRGRVFAQGFTICAVAFGMLYNIFTKKSEASLAVQDDKK